MKCACDGLIVIKVAVGIVNIEACANTRDLRAKSRIIYCEETLA